MATTVKNIELEKDELVDVEEEHSKHAISVGVATTAATNAVVAAVQATMEVVRLTTPKMFTGREGGGGDGGHDLVDISGVLGEQSIAGLERVGISGVLGKESIVGLERVGEAKVAC